MATVQPAAASKKPRTAVVVVHGMGEQKPLATLRGFVKALWTDDSDMVPIGRAETFSKPDRITGNFELRRITTLGGKGGRRADFFEFYWQHLMRGNDPTSVWFWVLRTSMRWPWTVPAPLLPLWVVLWFAVLAAAIGALFLYSPTLLGFGPWAAVVLSALSIAGGGLAAFSSYWIGPVLGDAARYFNASPNNVGARQSIREAGVDLIVKLHKSGSYDRIVVVAHSLGTAIALDVLYHTFARIPAPEWAQAFAPNSRLWKAVQDLDRLTAQLQPSPKRPLTDWERIHLRCAQRRAFRHLRTAKAATGEPLWLISDFVTLGSPLTYADVFIDETLAGFETRVRDRETAICPPIPDRPMTKGSGFLYPQSNPTVPHHASIFAFTAWTNIYFDNFLAAFGDVIGGPVQSLYGGGAFDIKIANRRYFQHNSYWLEDASIKAMRKAADIQEKSFP